MFQNSIRSCIVDSFFYFAMINRKKYMSNYNVKCQSMFILTVLLHLDKTIVIFILSIFYVALYSIVCNCFVTAVFMFFQNPNLTLLYIPVMI